ncbi:hypothetical protein Pla100_08410 [Neorhodopirellula pilleata]|uniref:Uncharacterized protein n=1 Tax=Neorhodopirellula pilleata TaxID=2714738 RepID=A0A5C6AXU5_9BACT|nr:hypothetical protein Pla100_08410 [Neorhodopirellula pilleata]
MHLRSVLPNCNNDSVIDNWDETLTHNAGTNIYDTPDRVLLQSPIGYEGSKWSLYEYVGSNTLNAYDPYGEREFEEDPGKARAGVRLGFRFSAENDYDVRYRIGQERLAPGSG